jgi:RNA ligase (TIGR02306 family)
MRKLATIQLVDNITLIENSDNIELATIKGWNVVVKKNTFKVGDLSVYFEIDSFLPIRLWSSFLTAAIKPKKIILEGIGEIEGLRLKTKKIRGVISQGLLLPIKDFTELLDKTLEIDQDISEILGVYKYECPVPISMGGKAKGNFPELFPKSDEERIQNLKPYLSQYIGKSFAVTEKLDGSSCSMYHYQGHKGVCSRNLELEEDYSNIYWKTAKKYLENIPEGYMVQCELVGEGIQKNPLKLRGQDLYCFYVYKIDTQRYLDFYEMETFCENIGIDMVPTVYKPFIFNHSVQELLELANGSSLLNPNVIREGLVFRLLGSPEKVSFKAISNNYLLNDNS